MRTFFRRAFPPDPSAIGPWSAQNSPVRDGCWKAGEASDQRRHGAPAASTACWPLLLATAMVSATTLALEITFTRIFSIVFDYHYVALVLAIALLGLGVGAILAAATRDQQGHPAQQPPTRALWQVCTVAGALLIVVTVLITQTALATRVLVAAALALLPFLGAGLFLALVFMIEVARSRELYAADLLGAGVGCLVSLPALQWFGAENTLALAALSFLTLAAFLAITTDRRRWLFPTCIWLLLGGLLGLKMTAGLLTMQLTVFRHSHKHLGHILRQNPCAHVVDSRWSALARTDVVAFSQDGERQYVALTDGGAATVLAPLPPTPAAWNRWEHHAGLFPYRTSPRKRVLIIGSGGGLDVLLALHGGRRRLRPSRSIRISWRLRSVLSLRDAMSIMRLALRSSVAMAGCLCARPLNATT